MIDIRIVDPLDPEIAAIIAFHLSGMTANSPKESVYALGASGLSEDNVTLFGAFENETCLSIGAIKRLNATEGEIKSMRTIKSALGRGLGKSVLQHIIEFAKQNGLESLMLETGTGESFDAAHHIYKQHGFAPSPPFGDYKKSDFNRFYALKL